MSTERRRAEILREREEGRQARLAGKHIQTNPYDKSNSRRGQWMTGYLEAAAEERGPESANSDEELFVWLTAASEHGGSFVKHLATAALYADP